MTKRILIAPLLCLAACAAATDNDEGDAGEVESSSDLDPSTVQAEANAHFRPLPAVMESAKHPVTEAKITLGRQLFFDLRLSKNHDLACNSCHDLANYGVDKRSGSGKTSLGHRSQRGTRNAPTVYNAALHIAQFWDGRALDVEEQAKGPILNPIEMALADAATVVAVVKSIPGYAPLFSSAFPGARDPITYENLAAAIGAFERKLVTKDRFDRYLQGELNALTAEERAGLELFMSAGCPTCHSGAGVGGAGYRKLGVFKSYPTDDLGRYTITKREADKYFFKVPSLRNIDKTGPYFHDGSQATLADAVSVMAEDQTTKGKLTKPEIDLIVVFLRALTGELPVSYIKAPSELPDGPSTPAPDPR